MTIDELFLFYTPISAYARDRFGRPLSPIYKTKKELHEHLYEEYHVIPEEYSMVRTDDSAGNRIRVHLFLHKGQTLRNRVSDLVSIDWAEVSQRLDAADYDSVLGLLHNVLKVTQQPDTKN